MKTILLLAGRSRRFWPLQEKAFFPVCGKTLLEHQVGSLKDGGCGDITLVGGAHNLEAAKELFPRLHILEQKDLDLGMQGALLTALPKMKGPVMIVSTNDVVEPQAYALLRKAALKKGVDGAILARRVKRYFPGGYLTTKGGRALSVVEKPGEGKEPSDLVNIVAHVHNDPAALLKALKRVKSSRDDGYEQTLALLMKEHHYAVVPYTGLWQPVKYPWHLLALLPTLLGNNGKLRQTARAFVHPTAVIEGNVVLEEGVRVLPHATILGPTYIGRHSVIGTGALVRASSIGDSCVIGFGTEVKGSILAENVWTHMTYLGDSIIGSNVSFGGGCVLGNLRLDEEEISSDSKGEKVLTGLTKFGAVIGNDCRFGIQVGTNPGVKIGAGTFIAGGLFVNEDVPEGSFVRSKNGVVTISKNRSGAPGAALHDRAPERTKRLGIG